MSRKWLLFPFCLSVLLTLVPVSSASLTLRINESAIRVLFEEHGTPFCSRLKTYWDGE